MVARRIRAVLAVTALAGLVLVTTPTTASAAPRALTQISGDACPTGYVCMFRDTGFQGGGYGSRAHDLNDFRGIQFNDQMSSFINATSNRYCWYPDLNFTGAPRTVNAGEAGDVNLSSDNDLASSLSSC